eukprot:CAMPEP_0172326286 /NCGR_PEP_ID=MMETSP1058-20130122/56111_1 /TAXON_ID=83371 /ORGANISM="Detonula confervacea, Strain CCMP 353" /LENGTH=152 /DNA_ID=CAMNT_0013043035 /DNA_START=38 /DNA_END=496 /DNA_ORIENTATION=-
MNTAISILLTLAAAGSLDATSAFSTSWQSSCSHKKASLSAPVTTPCMPRSGSSELYGGGWGNNQERSFTDEEFGGVNGAPLYDSYEIEDRGKFMQRVNAERKTLRIKKAADLLEVARIAGVELKKKDVDPEKLDMFDVDDLSNDDEYLDVSI